MSRKGDFFKTVFVVVGTIAMIATLSAVLRASFDGDRLMMGLGAVFWICIMVFGMWGSRPLRER